MMWPPKLRVRYRYTPQDEVLSGLVIDSFVRDTAYYFVVLMDNGAFETWDYDSCTYFPEPSDGPYR